MDIDPRLKDYYSGQMTKVGKMRARRLETKLLAGGPLTEHNTMIVFEYWGASYVVEPELIGDHLLRYLQPCSECWYGRWQIGEGVSLLTLKRAVLTLDAQKRLGG